MKTLSLKAAVTVFAAGAVFAACHGAGSYTPAGQGFAPQTNEQAVTLPADLQRTSGVQAIPDRIPACTAKPAKIPGRYVVFFSSGNVKGTTYTGILKNSLWESVQLGKATPPPTSSPSPTSSPTTGPTPAPEYFYYGTYAIKNGNGGCAYLIATKSGKPFKGEKFNGEAIGQANITAKYYKETLIAFGALTIKVTGLSSSGGHGAFTMRDSKGHTTGTGTVSLVGRALLP
jgi:hypothetical protein